MASVDASYDIIFAGGGTVACVAASRLAKADSSLRILIIEAGPHTKDNLNHIIPGRYFMNLFSGAPLFTPHTSQPSEALGGRSTIVHTGRCLGGGSSVNAMMYTRAAASDYDDWETVHENPGWGSKKFIPLLKKAETFQPGGDSKIHGHSGPIKVSYTPDRNNIGTQLLDAAASFDKGRPQISDTSDFYTCNGYGRWAVYVDRTTGRRSDVPHHYIYNQNLKNLQIMTGRRVVRVIIEDNRAVGVEHVDDIKGRAKGDQRASISYASRFIVVSAGAFGSPAILERSGIGSASVLSANGVTQIVDLPGVGENYMDHNIANSTFIASSDADTLNAVLQGDGAEVDVHTQEWSETGRGLLTHNGTDAAIRMRPAAHDLKVMPEFEERWKTHFEKSLDKPVVMVAAAALYIGLIPEVLRKYKLFSMYCLPCYPVSKGRVHIQSGTDAYAPLAFHAGFLDEVADLVVLRWGYKHARELARRMACFRGEPVVEHPAFPAGSEASAIGECGGPVDATVPPIKYTLEDDKAIDDFIRRTIMTSFHSCGTCAMKPKGKGGVVDSRLNVYSVKGLKVADMSIVPSNVSANTYNTALGIGEKAAVIIAEDLDIKGVAEE